ncbi:MAG: lamin tail domain-containing protein [bacterium]
MTVDWCRLQFPLDVELPAGSSVTVYGRVFEAGVTDATPLNDVEDGFLGQVGVGPAGTPPDAAWRWADGVPNPGWDGLAAGEPDNDEWQAELVVPAPGAYAFAFRFSRDGGQTWLLCDRDAGPGQDGAEDGFQIGRAGTLVSAASPCEGVVCDAPGAPICEGDVRVAPRAPGHCEVQGAQGVCVYPADREDCALDGARCAAGACVGGPQPPVPGQLVVTEIMYDTEPPLAEAQAEWFEIQNVSAERLRLTGCLLRDSASQAVVGPLVLDPGAYAVFARSANPALNGGLAAVAGVFGFGLNNPGDTVAIQCGGVIVDTVSYGAGFPVATRRSLSLDPAATDAALNDAGASWCVGVDLYFAGAAAAEQHFGTPGAANPPCPVVDPCDPDPCLVPPPPVCEGRPPAGCTGRPAPARPSPARPSAPSTAC